MDEVNSTGVRCAQNATEPFEPKSSARLRHAADRAGFTGRVAAGINAGADAYLSKRAGDAELLEQLRSAWKVIKMPTK
jgi:hypothetical protein